MNLTKQLRFHLFFAGIIFIVNEIIPSYEIDITYNDSQTLENVTDYYEYSSLVSKRYKRQNINTGHDCEIPNYPRNTKYKIINDPEGRYNSGDYVNEFSTLVTICDKRYQLPPFAVNSSTCFNGRWSNPLPACLRTCKSLMSTLALSVQCVYNDTIALENCIHPVEETKVVLSCNRFYESDAINNNPTRWCINGAWTPNLPQCEPTCGWKTPKATFTIVNGTNATPGDYPWQVGIYTNVKKEFKCGGSIIQPNIVLSAAHCFSDYAGNVLPAQDYVVAAGKYYSQYYDSRDELAQYSKVRHIFVPEMYKSLIGLQSHDIAVVLLEDTFTLTVGVLPVCIELTAKSQYTNYMINNNGIVTGWGYTQERGKPSEVLKELIIPTVSYDECYSKVPMDFKKFFTFDKMCGGYLNESTSVCSGDSGGGLVYNISGLYYVKGIVSTSPATSVSGVTLCDSNHYSLFTKVDSHIDFLTRRVTIHGSSSTQSIECEREDCKTEKTESGCGLPTFPPNGKYSFATEMRKYEPGSYVQIYSTIVLSCDYGYNTNPSGTRDIICLGNDEWLPPIEPRACTRAVFSRIQPSNQPDRIMQVISLEVGEKSRLKCQEYINQVYKNEDFSDSSKCPITEVGNVVQITPAMPKEFPHVASVGIDSTVEHITWGCLGTLISESFVLSSAECGSFRRDSTTVQHIQLGELIMDSSDDDAEPQLLRIKNIYIHPDYKPPSVYNDIGLRELERNVIFSTYVRPACLNTNPNIINKFSVGSGWGRKSEQSGYVDKHMQKTTLDMFTTSECADVYRQTKDYREAFENGILEEKLICAGSRNKSEVDICRAGGPLQILNSEGIFCTYTLIGISSHGEKCGTPNVPGVYTRVSFYIQWIEDIVWP